ncbi:MAG: hypothetical protein HGA45_20980 [Chloroflexales bacterium]|nr:hypothetical protein [Chloroflexales bacterium]
MNDTLVTNLDHALAAVDTAACDAYRRQSWRLIEYADQHMAARPDLAALLGPCPPEVLYRNHADHARFIEAQLRLKSASALINAFVWVYRTHRLRGVALECFPVDLAIWTEAIERYLDEPNATQVSAVYRCLRDMHGQLVRQADAPQHEPATTAELQPHFQRYLAALLKPDAQAAIRITGEYVRAPAQITTWWEQVIQPSMYTIGDLWAQGQISVGQEHLATAITQRVMAIYYPLILELPRLKGAIVVTASPGEHHEIGPRIVADLLEIHGWDVYYTGANTPAQSIIELLRHIEARFLCISTTLVHSLPSVTALIAQVRSAGLWSSPKILVGGQAYMAGSTLWRQVGADWFAPTAHDGIGYIEACHSAGRA